MGDEETNQNDKAQVKKLSQSWAIIIAAIISAAAIIIAALINVYRVQTIEVILTDMETKQGIPGEVFIDANEDGKPSYPDNPAVIRVRRGNRFIRAESEGYEPRVVPIERGVSILNVDMRNIAVISAISETRAIPVSFAGRRLWGHEITIATGASANEVIVNGAIADVAGFFITGLPSAMRGKTLILYFSNTEASRFSQNRMVKLEYNVDDILLRPINASLLYGEYLPAEDTPTDNGIEFPIPDNFDGRLAFIFYQAELHDLKITAYYK